MKVTLYVRSGEIAAEAETIPFQLMPEVLVWGNRIFVRDIFKDAGKSYGYTEACGYYLQEGQVKI